MDEKNAIISALKEIIAKQNEEKIFRRADY